VSEAVERARRAEMYLATSIEARRNLTRNKSKRTMI